MTTNILTNPGDFIITEVHDHNSSIMIIRILILLQHNDQKKIDATLYISGLTSDIRIHSSFNGNADFADEIRQKIFKYISPYSGYLRDCTKNNVGRLFPANPNINKIAKLL